MLLIVKTTHSMVPRKYSWRTSSPGQRQGLRHPSPSKTWPGRSDRQALFCVFVSHTLLQALITSEWYKACARKLWQQPEDIQRVYSSTAGKITSYLYPILQMVRSLKNNRPHQIHKRRGAGQRAKKKTSTAFLLLHVVSQIRQE